MIGGLYGIGGGSILAPILIALGYSVYEVAPATLAATLLTSLAGVGNYQVLQAVRIRSRPAPRPTEACVTARSSC
jgi:uncharacterized membrane protein YfcA